MIENAVIAFLHVQLKPQCLGVAVFLQSCASAFRSTKLTALASLKQYRLDFEVRLVSEQV